jgi:hypothetical protein
MKIILIIKQQPGSLIDWEKWNFRVLAFFPVVAISSNLSTRILWVQSK